MTRILSFEEAKKLVKKHKIQNARQYKLLIKQNKLPRGLPKCPEYYYGWGANAKRQGRFPQYEKAKIIVKKLKIKSKTQWDKYKKLGKLPEGIPKDPRCVYKEKFKGWGDWLGTGNVQYIKGYSTEGIKFWSYKKCRTYIRKFNFFSSVEFKKAFKKGKISKHVPQSPPDVFKQTNEWESWPKFLGHNNMAGAMANYNFWNFEKAKRWAKKSGIKTMREFKKLHGKGKIPKSIPCHADDYYKKTGKWKGWNDFIGSTKGVHISKYHKWRSFEEAREWVRKKKFKTIKEYKEFCKSGKKPIDIPVDPQRIYGESFFTGSKKD